MARSPLCGRVSVLWKAVGETGLALVISTPIPPTSCLPLGQQRGLGKLGPFGSRPHSYSSPADVEPGLGSARLLSALGGGDRLGPGTLHAACFTESPTEDLCPTGCLRLLNKGYISPN